MILEIYSVQSELPYKEIITEMPSLAVAFLVCCILLVMAFILHSVFAIKGEVKTLKSFVLFAVIQQLMTLNFIGAGISYLYYRIIPKAEKTDKIKRAPLILALVILVTVLSLLSAVLLLIQTIK
ncbi:hypothetical protein [Lactovum odontotermitis]